MCSANRDEPSDAHGGAGWGLLTLRWRVEQQRDLLKGVTTSTINILSSSCTLYSQTGMTYHPQGYKNKHMSSFSGHIWHFKTFSQAGKWVNSTSLIITAWRSRCRGGEAPDIQTLTHRELPSVWVQLLQCCCSPTCSRAHFEGSGGGGNTVTHMSSYAHLFSSHSADSRREPKKVLQLLGGFLLPPLNM